jgi:cytochrome P450
MIEGDVRRAADDAVATVAGGAGCELIGDFARPFATTVFIEQLFRFPRDMAAQFVTWNFMLLHGRTADERRRNADELIDFLTHAIEERMHRPVEADLISLLLSSTVDGRAVTREEVLDTAFLLFMAGLDTVATALGFAFNQLARHPEHRRTLTRTPSIVPAAVEELLRYNAFVSNTRTVTRNVEFHGVELREGDRMHLPGAVASRDPNEFDRPAELVLDRPNNRHMAFGAGPHRCLGMHLARLQLASALVSWHDRVPEYTLDVDDPVTFRGGTILGVDRLALRWAP